jgi:hypothetical protein
LLAGERARARAEYLICVPAVCPPAAPGTQIVDASPTPNGRDAAIKIVQQKMFNWLGNNNRGSKHVTGESTVVCLPWCAYWQQH